MIEAECKFWQSLTDLLNGDPAHDTAMVQDFSRVSKIPEYIVRLKLQAALHSLRRDNTIN